MPAPKIPLTNMSKGEFSPRLYARPDIPQYAAGVKKAQNFIIQKEAGMSFRPGFRFCGEVRDVDGKYRMEPFILTSRLAAVRVFGDYGQEVLAQGGFVVEEDLKIDDISYGANTTIEVPYHGWAVGDRILLTGNTGPNINDRVVTITAVIDENHVAFALDTTGQPALTASTGIVRSGAPAEPPPPPEPLPEPEPPPTGPGEGTGEGSNHGIGNGNGGYFPPNEN